ncbi:MAG: hypothetical protein AAFR18_14845 [Cyanobacteria bacterium J06627_32]
MAKVNSFWGKRLAFADYPPLNIVKAIQLSRFWRFGKPPREIAPASLCQKHITDLMQKAVSFSQFKNLGKIVSRVSAVLIPGQQKIM